MVNPKSMKRRTRKGRIEILEKRNMFAHLPVSMSLPTIDLNPNDRLFDVSPVVAHNPLEQNIDDSDEPVGAIQSEVRIVGYSGPSDVSVEPNEHSGVGRLSISGSEGNSLCTGTLLPDGKSILTAAHCLAEEDASNLVANSVTFANAFGTSRYTIDKAIVHSGWRRDRLFDGNDIAILRLSDPVSTDVARYPINRGRGEIGKEVSLIGYGLSGSGNDGVVGRSAGVLRAGSNTIDASRGKNSSLLVYDFDNGKFQNDHTRLITGRFHLGLGRREAMTAPGDSGGPNLIDGKIAGITSFGQTRTDLSPVLNPDVDNALNSSFGELGYSTRVSTYANWIDNSIDSPSIYINNFAGLPPLTNHREITVSLDDFSDATRVRYAFNGFNYGPWVNFQRDMTITTPNYKGVNWLNFQFQTPTGVKYEYQSVKYKIPKLVTANGADVVYSRNVDLKFEDVDARVKSVRYAINGFNWGPSESFTKEKRITIPSTSTSYINAQLQYQDGTTRHIYKRVRYVKPSLLINEGAVSTTNRTISIQLQNIAENAKSMRFAINGFNYGEPHSFSNRHQLTLPAYYGTNYVNAEIEFEDGKKRHVWSKIKLTRASASSSMFHNIDPVVVSQGNLKGSSQRAFAELDVTRQDGFFAALAFQPRAKSAVVQNEDLTDIMDEFQSPWDSNQRGTLPIADHGHVQDMVDTSPESSRVPDEVHSYLGEGRNHEGDNVHLLCDHVFSCLPDFRVDRSLIVSVVGFQTEERLVCFVDSYA